ncbi:organic cation transporter protein [Exaiptasia diaphana]|uniref:Major facilitator superfamily (MFS) profile domain-containing protein n=1 Tax=Exaiptasia diaphana TaxID=2652724 RepID=A0A913WVB0_EXADI|nr:organic cation transporter protein [Exaiptasia diaphana]
MEDKEAEPSPTEQNFLSEFDNVFELVNSFGRYQKIVYFTSCFLILLLSFPFGFMVFGFATPNFQCAVENSTCAINKCCNNCTSYMFIKPPFTTVVTEFNTVCNRAYLNAVIQSCMFVGMWIGAVFSGMISDAFGRKKCIFLCNGIMTVAGFASSFSDCVSLMAFLWFIMGFGLTGLTLSQYIYVMEIVGPKARTMAGNINWLYWSAGYFLYVLLAYYIREWRILMAVSSIPGVLLFLFWKIFPESPRWLVAHDKLDEAHAILIRFGGKSKENLDPNRLKSFLEDVRKTQFHLQHGTKVFSPVSLCKTPKLRKWSAALGVNWFATSFLANALFLYVTSLSGNIYLNFTIIQVIATVQQPFLWILLKMFGRRIPHMAVMLTISVLVFSVLIVPSKYPMVKSGLFLGAAGITFCLWTTIYMITSELYPTVIRNTAQGTGSMVGRTGAISAPYVAMLARIPGVSVAVPVVIFGVISLIAGVVALIIPETLFIPMHQTIEEAENADEDYGIPRCGKPRRNSKHAAQANAPLANDDLDIKL